MHANEDIMFTVLHIYKYQYKWGTKNINDWSPYLASNLTPNAHVCVFIGYIPGMLAESGTDCIYTTLTIDLDVTDIHWCVQSTVRFFSG